MKLLSYDQHFPKSMRPSRAGNSHTNSRKWAKIELVGDFMPAKIELVNDLIVVLITCKCDEESIKNEVAIVLTTFS